MREIAAQPRFGRLITRNQAIAYAQDWCAYRTQRRTGAARGVGGATSSRGDPIAVDLTLGFGVLPDGEQFLAARRMADPDGSVPSITVVRNWFAEFAKKR